MECCDRMHTLAADISSSHFAKATGSGPEAHNTFHGHRVMQSGTLRSHRSSV